MTTQPATPETFTTQLTIFLTAQQQAMALAPELTGDQIDRIGNLAVERFETVADITELHLKYLIRKVKTS